METKPLKAPKLKSTTNKSDFPIIGIGASAGGLEALEQFFENMPADSGLAFVVIQHLDPDHVGIMPELLQRITTMKVFQATDKLVVKPNHVYVIPPNKSMSILRGALFLFDKYIPPAITNPAKTIAPGINKLFFCSFMIILFR